MYEALLVAHGLSGALALLGALGAISSRLVRSPHRVHAVSGTGFTAGMVGVGATGLVITAVNPSVFLLGLAVLALYFALSGWAYAKVRRDHARPMFKLGAALFTAAFAALILYAAWLYFARGIGMGIPLGVFSVIGLLQARADLRTALGRPLPPKERIAAHLSRMMGGTIAAVTAFLLVQLQTSSVIVWLAPTILITPLIVLWSRKVRGGWMARSPA